MTISTKNTYSMSFLASLAIFVENIGLHDMPPLSQGMQSGPKSFSPILSHTLTVVVQWEMFGNSTTLNNKGSEAHKEMGHVS